MATLNQIRQAVNEWLAARWPLLIARQESYFVAHGRYFQGLWTHGSFPADGAETAPDGIAARPTDQAEGWPDLISLPDVLPCALRIDTYHGPQGYGWSARLRVRVAGVVYERIGQVGPETWRVQDWQAMPEGG